MANSSTSKMDTELGLLVVEQGLATAKDVQDCRDMMQQGQSAETDSSRTLADLLISNGIITQRQLDRLLQSQLEDSKPASTVQQQQIPGYQILGKLGAGAMATVFKARQLSLDRIVAIKVLPSKHTNKPDFVQRFYAEGRAAAKLNHPNIVQAIDVGKAGDYHYFVMEYVEGRTVFDDITANRRYTEKQALDIIIQIAKALNHAHQAGFIHRDVKPKNIMITKDGIAKLADMGLARAVTDREAAEAEQGKAFGTPYYISPEQIRGQVNVDFRADIYSLGATFYHMVTGQVPFDGPNPSAVMHKHLKANLVPPDHLNAQLSAGVSEIIEVCMAKNADQRYNSTADLLRDLEAVVQGNAPMQARKKFDLSSLALIEQSATPLSGPVQTVEEELDHRVDSGSLPFFLQPLFFVALAGWLVALILMAVLLMQ